MRNFFKFLQIFAILSLSPAWGAYVPNTVTSGTVHQRNEWIKLSLTAGGCTIDRQSGSWVASCVRNGTGDATLTFTSGTYSGSGSCLCTAEQGGTLCIPFNSSQPTSSAYRFTVFTTGGSPSDFGVTIMCMGVK